METIEIIKMILRILILIPPFLCFYRREKKDAIFGMLVVLYILHAWLS
jgi:hypothetical protein